MTQFLSGSMNYALDTEFDEIVIIKSKAYYYDQNKVVNQCELLRPSFNEPISVTIYEKRYKRLESADSWDFNKIKNKYPHKFI